MKKYYLHNGTESSGPFDIEELKAKNITTKTPVWFEGMERWKTAGEIEELLSLFISIPPIETLITEKSIPPTQKVEEEESEEKTILGLSKTSFWVVAVILMVAIGTIVFNTLQENRKRELELKNHKTEIENHQYELKQKEIEEQKIQMEIQEKLEAERIIKEKKQNTTHRISEIEKILADLQNNIVATENKLKEASGFKLLRTASEKKEQMSLLQKDIDSLKNEKIQLKNESDQLKLELEKYPK